MYWKVDILRDKTRGGVERRDLVSTLTLIEDETLLVGRSRKCNIVIPKDTVSRVQCALFLESDTCVVENRSSSVMLEVEGVFLKPNARRVFRSAVTFNIEDVHFELAPQEGNPVERVLRASEDLLADGDSTVGGQGAASPRTPSSAAKPKQGSRSLEAAGSYAAVVHDLESTEIGTDVFDAVVTSDDDSDHGASTQSGSVAGAATRKPAPQPASPEPGSIGAEPVANATRGKVSQAGKGGWARGRGAQPTEDASTGSRTTSVGGDASRQTRMAKQQPRRTHSADATDRQAGKPFRHHLSASPGKHTGSRRVAAADGAETSASSMHMGMALASPVKAGASNFRMGTSSGPIFPEAPFPPHASMSPRSLHAPSAPMPDTPSEWGGSSDARSGPPSPTHYSDFAGRTPMGWNGRAHPQFFNGGMRQPHWEDVHGRMGMPGHGVVAMPPAPHQERHMGATWWGHQPAQGFFPSRQPMQPWGEQGLMQRQWRDRQRASDKPRRGLSPKRMDSATQDSGSRRHPSSSPARRSQSRQRQAQRARSMSPRPVYQDADGMRRQSSMARRRRARSANKRVRFMFGGQHDTEQAMWRRRSYGASGMNGRIQVEDAAYEGLRGPQGRVGMLPRTTPFTTQGTGDRGGVSASLDEAAWQLEAEKRRRAHIDESWRQHVAERVAHPATTSMPTSPSASRGKMPRTGSDSTLEGQSCTARVPAGQHVRTEEDERWESRERQIMWKHGTAPQWREHWSAAKRDEEAVQAARQHYHGMHWRSMDPEERRLAWRALNGIPDRGYSHTHDGEECDSGDEGGAYMPMGPMKPVLLSWRQEETEEEGGACGPTWYTPDMRHGMQQAWGEEDGWERMHEGGLHGNLDEEWSEEYDEQRMHPFAQEYSRYQHMHGDRLVHRMPHHDHHDGFTVHGDHMHMASDVDDSDAPTDSYDDTQSSGESDAGSW